MSVLFMLIFFALLFALFFLGAFYVASKTGQFDDVDTPAQRILCDDAPIKQKNNNKGEA